ncbi:unnamed protein product [Calypogeia fissa]
MPKDVNYPCTPDVSKGEILFDWSETHIHEYRHFGTPWIFRIQCVKDNAAMAFIHFRDLFSEAEIPIPPNVRLRDDCAEKDVPPYHQNNHYFQITPFTNFCLLIHVSKVALKIVKQPPPYFSIITPGPNVSFTFIRQTKPQEKLHMEKAAATTSKTPEEEENAMKLALLMAEPHWDTLEETFPAKSAPPTIRQHPDKKQESVFSV